MPQWDVIIVGAGIAGASVAYELAPGRRVLVLERESQPGYHATGRSGAVFIDAYGNEVVQALTAAGKPFMLEPPPGFCAGPLLTPREVFVVGTAEQAEIIEGLAEMVSAIAPAARLVDGAAVEARVPLLRRGAVARALHDPETKDIDVAALLQGFLRGAKERGASVQLGAEVLGLERRGSQWHVRTRAGEEAAPVLVNAAGAWADALATLAGVTQRGLTPLRRSLFALDPPAGVDVRAWPLVADVGETWYFKPESGRILASPSEEDPVAPCDARPDDLVLAKAVDRLQGVLELEVRRLAHKWAGLRTFAPDRSPVVGYDPDAQGFFWLAGQGGFGLQTAPAVARLAAALIAGAGVPPELAACGVEAAAVAPERLAPAG